MNRRQKIFLLIALIYLINKIGTSIWMHYYKQNLLEIPGWHSVIIYNAVFNSVLMVIYFIAVGLIYGTEVSKTIGNILFWIHAGFSILPAMIFIIWPLFTESETSYFENAILIYRSSVTIEWIFLTGQGLFILILTFLHFRSRKVRSEIL